MKIREAVIADIPQIQAIRHAVKENRLSDPGLVTDLDCENFLTKRGKGWVCEWEGQMVGFAIVDLQEKNIWALFIDPAFERRGIGSRLQKMMLDWYFSRETGTLWLGTAPGTRAEGFYKMTGWQRKGLMKNGELRFEMDRATYGEIGREGRS